jgi:hypothetical protein
MRAVKEECLGRMSFFGQRSLREAAASFLDHFHRTGFLAKDNTYRVRLNSSRTYHRKCDCHRREQKSHQESCYRCQSVSHRHCSFCARYTRLNRSE